MVNEVEFVEKRMLVWCVLGKWWFSLIIDGVVLCIKLIMVVFSYDGDVKVVCKEVLDILYGVLFCGCFIV